MNNDISGELSKHIATNSRHAATKKAGLANMQNNNACSESSYTNNQNYLSMLGRVKVSMEKTDVAKRVASSMEMLKQDPEYVQQYINFSSALQKQGYSLENAIIGTDIVFEKLKDESTYQPKEN